MLVIVPKKIPEKDLKLEGLVLISKLFIALSFTAKASDN